MIRAQLPLEGVLSGIAGAACSGGDDAPHPCTSSSPFCGGAGGALPAPRHAFGWRTNQLLYTGTRDPEHRERER